MRCYCCNASLNDYESTRKLISTGDFLDVCNGCYKDMEYDVPTVGRTDLLPNEQPDGYEQDYDEIDEADQWMFDNDYQWDK